MSQEPSLTSTDSQLLTEVRDLTFVVRVMWSVMVGLAAFLSYGILNALPRLETILIDMFGDPRKIPELAYLVLSWARLGEGLVANAFLGLASSAGIVLPWFIRRTKLAVIASLCGGVLLMLHSFLCCAAIFSGLTGVLKAIASSS